MKIPELGEEVIFQVKIWKYHKVITLILIVPTMQLTLQKT